MIPRTIHRIWLGGSEPEWTQPFATAWGQPGWEVITHPAPPFPLKNQAVYDDAERIAPNHVGQLRSDILRLEILHRFGGVYVDHDFECLQPIDPLIDDLECFAAWEEPGRWINNAILGSTPGHPFIEALIDGLPANVERFANHKPNRMTGPKYLTPVWLSHGKGVTILDRDLFYPYSWRDIDSHGPGDEFPGAYAVHHWNNKRRERGVPC